MVKEGLRATGWVVRVWGRGGRCSQSWAELHRRPDLAKAQALEEKQRKGAGQRHTGIFVKRAVPSNLNE